MEATEEPAPERTTVPRTTQACQRCRSLKTRCLPSERQGTCRRCLSSNRSCEWAELPRKAKRIRGPSRISQVEKKIDGLVANLVASRDPTVQHPPQSSPAHPDQSLNTATVSISRSEHTLAPGSWLRTPDSFEPQRASSRESSLEGNDIQEHGDGYLDRLGEMQSFVSSETRTEDSTHQSLQVDARSANSRLQTKETPLEDELVQRLITNGEADTMLQEYCTMLPHFPFVPLLPTITAQSLGKSEPMLLLAVLTVCSFREPKLQRTLDEKYRVELANRTVVRPMRSLSLLQSMLVYLGWYHFVFSHKTEQIYSLVQLATGMAMDLSLHREQRRTLSIPGRPSPPPLPESVQRARQRTLLGCYYLSCACSISLMKPNLLRSTNYMINCARNLRQYSDFATDELMQPLISLSRIDDCVQDMVPSDGTDEESILNPGMNMKLLEQHLEQWKSDVEQCRDTSKLLELSFAYTDLELHAIALRPATNSYPSGSFPENFAYGQQSPHTPENIDHINALSRTLEAGKRFLDALLALSPDTYPHLCFNVWLKLPHVILTLTRLCMPNNRHLDMIAWDVKAAQERVRLDLYLESLCYRMQNLSPVGGWDGRRETMLDFWRAMNMILDLTKTWYVKKIRTSTNHLGRGARTASTMGSQNGSTTGLPLSPDIPGTHNNHVSTETAGPMEYQMNALARVNGTGTAETECPLANIQANCPFSASSLNGGPLNIPQATQMAFNTGDNNSSDPFAVLKSGDFDMDLFLDMGIWGSESYYGMGFGGGHSDV